MHKDLKSERIQIYFDCICGTISSISALIGIFYFTLPSDGIKDPTFFVIGTTFWFGYLFLSLFIIGVGIYTYYTAKNFSPDDQIRKKLKVPIVG
jgi:hypothetical protein